MIMIEGSGGRSGKRLFDVVISGTAMLVLSPLFLILATAVWIDVGRPVFFVQERPGLGGHPFRLYKFRTMVMQAGAGADTSDQQRITRLGSILRNLSLDELPELWNVFIGDMSLVGPRPLLMEYLPLYDERQARRHEVRPGITGWAQVNGRNRLPWPARFELDVWYVDHRSFRLDLRILGMTLWQVLRRQGINESGEITMSRFTGNQS